MSGWIPEWAQKKYEAWTDPMAWIDTAASWTSKEEWKQWYAGSTLESAANIVKATPGVLKATPGVGVHFVATLLETPAMLALDIALGTPGALKSAAHIVKATPGIGAHFVATLLEPPLVVTFDILGGVISGAKKANQAFQGFAKEACRQSASAQKEEKDASWLMSWFKSIGMGFSQFLATIWKFLKSPFIIN